MPSPGEETGQRLEHPLPSAGRKYRSQEGGGWGLTSHSRDQEKPSSACLCLLLTYQTLWKQNKQVLRFPGERPGQREKGCDRPYESKIQGAVGLQEGFLEEGHLAPKLSPNPGVILAPLLSHTLYLTYLENPVDLTCHVSQILPFSPPPGQPTQSLVSAPALGLPSVLIRAARGICLNPKSAHGPPPSAPSQGTHLTQVLTQPCTICHPHLAISDLNSYNFLPYLAQSPWMCSKYSS